MEGTLLKRVLHKKTWSGKLIHLTSFPARHCSIVNSSIFFKKDLDTFKMALLGIHYSLRLILKYNTPVIKVQSNESFCEVFNRVNEVQTQHIWSFWRKHKASDKEDLWMPKRVLKTLRPSMFVDRPLRSKWISKFVQPFCFAISGVINLLCLPNPLLLFVGKEFLQL